MIKILFSVFLLFPVVSINAQKYFSGNGDYSLRIDERVQFKHLDTDAGGFADSYILREDGKFKYMVSITESKPPSLTQDAIFKEEYKRQYLSECSCKILEQRQITLQNVEGIEFTIQTEVSGNRIKGLSVSAIKSNLLFTIKLRKVNLIPASQFLRIFLPM